MRVIGYLKYPLINVLIIHGTDERNEIPSDESLTLVVFEGDEPTEIPFDKPFGSL